MHSLSNFLPTTAVGKWMFGALMFPAEFALRELFLNLGKLNNSCDETMFEYYKKNFQKIDCQENRYYYLTQSNKIRRFVAEKFVNFAQASVVALIEESFFRFGLQYFTFRWIPSCFYEEATLSEEQAFLMATLRVILTTTLFGFIHYQSAEVRNERKRNVLTLEQVKKERNFQVIGAWASGIVYGTVYEVTKQSFWAVHGCHTMWNFMHDVIVLNSWQKKPMQKQKQIRARSVVNRVRL